MTHDPLCICGMDPEGCQEQEPCYPEDCPCVCVDLERVRPIIEAQARAAERTEILDRVREVHYPKKDPGYSLVTWEYCSCGAMEVSTAEDGYPSIGPATYPCATLRALGEAEQS